VSAISHDLRTPLASIKGYSEFLEDELGGPLTDQQRTFVRQIEQSSRRLENLVDDLLDLARFEAGTFQLRVGPTDVLLRVRQIVESLLPQVEEARLSIRVSLPEQPLEILADAERIERVISNLLSNAIKFTPPGGRIEIRACLEGDHLRCEVEDSGVGIAAEDLSKLFRPFSQLESGIRKGGTGLGLSISKSIVEAHGGTIGVASEPGKGSTIWFTLPRS
jgi:signal transduction histidine kinase